VPAQHTPLHFFWGESSRLVVKGREKSIKGRPALRGGTVFTKKKKRIGREEEKQASEKLKNF